MSNESNELNSKQFINAICDLAEAALLSGDKKAAADSAHTIVKTFVSLGLDEGAELVNNAIAEHYESLPSAAMTSADVILSILRNAKSSALPPLAWLEMANEHGIETEVFLRVVQMLVDVGVIYKSDLAGRIFVYRLNAYKQKSADEDAPLLSAKKLCE